MHDLWSRATTRFGQTEQHTNVIRPASNSFKFHTLDTHKSLNPIEIYQATMKPKGRTEVEQKSTHNVLNGLKVQCVELSGISWQKWNIIFMSLF